MTSTNHTCTRGPRLRGHLPGSSALTAAIALALGVAPTVRAADDPPQQKPQAVGGLEEIIVTATRRAQSVQDVPYNISAITGAQIRSAGVVDLVGVTRLVPGLQAPDLGARASSTNSTFIIRGLNTNNVASQTIAPNLSVPLVSTYVDDVPLFTNLRLTDIQRVEVLRGPQGTLYGSGSIGGTVRVLHNSPTTKRTEFEVSTSAERTESAGDTSYSVDTVLNLPLGERVAWRMSASYEKQAGFIDANRAVLYAANRQPVLADPANPLTSDYATGSIKDINSSRGWHVRNALLWEISDSVSTELVYHHQSDKADGFATQTPGQPRYTTSNQIPVQPIDRKVDMVSLSITADVGFATLTSSSSWYKNSYNDLFDSSAFETLFNRLPGYYGGYPRVSVFNYDFSEDKSFAQEFRFVSKSKGAWDWIGGLFFQDQKQHISDPEYLAGFGPWSALPGSGVAAQAYYGLPNDPTQTFDSVAQAEGRLPPSGFTPTDYYYNFTRTARYREYAAYGELTYKPAPEWQITGGARVFWQKFSQNLENFLPACGPYCSQDGTDPQGITFAGAETSTHDQVFKFNTSYKLTPETTTYLTIAQGYRHGGANAQCATPTGSSVCYSTAEAALLIPYKPDKALNYEFGVKGTTAGHRVQYSFGVYRIDWKDIQLETFSPVTGTTLIVNGETARSQGLEAEVTLQPVENLSLTFGYAYNDSKLTAQFIEGSFVGRDGDRLPYVSRNTASLALDYFQPVRGVKGIDYNIDASYRSNVATRLNDCDAQNDVLRCPAPTNANGGSTGYGVLDGFTLLNASITVEMNDQWSFRAYGANLTNELGITATALTSALDRNNREYVMRPRTFGVEARYQFK